MLAYQRVTRRSIRCIQERKAPCRDGKEGEGNAGERQPGQGERQPWGRRVKQGDRPGGGGGGDNGANETEQREKDGNEHVDGSVQALRCNGFLQRGLVGEVDGTPNHQSRKEQGREP